MVKIKRNKVLVVSAHPDDETLGVGGILLRHRDRGDDVYWVLFTYQMPGMYKKIVNLRRRYIDDIAGRFGMVNYWIGEFFSTELVNTDINRLLEFVEPIVKKIKPDIVYTVGPYDIHTDHKAVFNVMSVLSKPVYGVSQFYIYEIPSSTNWAIPWINQYKPLVYVDIEKYIEEKLEILSLFEDQIFPYPHARSLEAVRAYAMYRGSSIGLKYAETLMPIRVIYT